MLNRKEANARDQRFPIERNKRITAIAGTVLFVLILAELIITANLHALTSEHIFVGILLMGPLVVKMGSTGYRFFRYYTRSPEFVKAGPPNPLLRVLAPFLVVVTLLVFVSGLGLVLGGQAHEGLFHKIHTLSVTLWLPLLGVHIYAYIRKATGLNARDWASKSKFRVPGRGGRLGMNVAALILSCLAGVIITPWGPVGHGHWGLPGPIALGIAAALIAVLIAVPLLRLTNKRPQL